eukprot:TRINITY_DN631_c1_g1_i1.p1 TRINITY_DN631_c1_g1~~TRINITY_DN631_c1_g1_i1.p1  ORF type:complete len:232 (+),score=63.37 TRINITY_DN631_c1_g1_i1:59-754(+)
MDKQIKYLNQEEARLMDVELMGEEHGFTVDQLMELAGLSVAESLYQEYGLDKKNILVIAGPGNNGGDGLVSARHLFYFGYNVTVLYPKSSKNHPMPGLIKQLTKLKIKILDTLEEDFDKKYDVLVDAIFGYSFKGEIREPFKNILNKINKSQFKDILSVDIPSGWDVEKGNITNEGLSPSVLISLTAPKQCALNFKGRHYLGGRFVVPEIDEKYQLNLPKYKSTQQAVLLN